MITPSITPKKLKHDLSILLDANIPVFIHGSPGIGKSYIVGEMCKNRGWELLDVRLSQLDAVDLRGIPSIDEGETKWVPPVFLPKVECEGVLFLDELNSAPPSIQAAIYQLVLDRKLGEYELPKGWRIVSAGNRVNDKGIVFKLPSPLSNRMVHLVLESSYDDFKEWALHNSIHPYIVGFLGYRRDLLSSEVPKESETNPAFATPRSWTMLSRILGDVLHNLDKLSSIIYGSVGYGAGVEFISFTKIYKELPDIDALLRGEIEKLPETPASLYALNSALIHKFNGTKGETLSLLNISEKLPIEFGVMLIKDALQKYEEIAELSEFGAWLERYEEYII